MVGRVLLPLVLIGMVVGEIVNTVVEVVLEVINGDMVAVVLLVLLGEVVCENVVTTKKQRT